MAVAHARPDFEAHSKAVRASFPEVAAALRALLGARLVAYLGSVRETRAVNQWADGSREPSAEVQQRLRVALQIALTIAASESEQIAQAWFQGLNPQLDDRSPARLLREGDVDEVGPVVITAAPTLSSTASTTNSSITHTTNSEPPATPTPSSPAASPADPEPTHHLRPGPTTRQIGNWPERQQRLFGLDAA